jgi:hypothetical protein
MPKFGIYGVDSEYAEAVSRLASRVEGCREEGAMRSASECRPRIARGESAGGAMQCDAGGLGVQRLEACRDVGGVRCATALAVDERLKWQQESDDAGGWRGEGVMNGVAGCGRWVGNEGVKACKPRADLDPDGMRWELVGALAGVA